MYIGYLYPIRIFKRSFFRMGKLYPAMLTTLVALGGRGALLNPQQGSVGSRQSACAAMPGLKTPNNRSWKQCLVVKLIVFCIKSMTANLLSQQSRFVLFPFHSASHKLTR